MEKRKTSLNKPEKLNATHIYLENNNFKSIPKYIGSKIASVLYMHSNSITEINNLNNLCNLTHLYLQWNKIQRIENLNCMKNLKKLYLGNNKINVIENLGDLENLTELHVEHQILEKGEILCFEPRCMSKIGNSLQVLNISYNKLSYFSELLKLKNLIKIIAIDNIFQDYLPIIEDLKQLIKIKDIDFRGNPMCKTHRYKEKIIATCYKLEIIDGRQIPEQTRHSLKSFDKFQNNLESNQPIFIKKMSQNVLTKVSTSKSPDAHLTYLEAQRMAAVQTRLSRQKLLEANNGVIPRCFWRNKNTRQIKEILDQDENIFHNFTNSNTCSVWP